MKLAVDKSYTLFEQNFFFKMMMSCYNYHEHNVGAQNREAKSLKSLFANTFRVLDINI